MVGSLDLRDQLCERGVSNRGKGRRLRAGVLSVAVKRRGYPRQVCTTKVSVSLMPPGCRTPRHQPTQLIPFALTGHEGGQRSDDRLVWTGTRGRCRPQPYRGNCSRRGAVHVPETRGHIDMGHRPEVPFGPRSGREDLAAVLACITVAKGGISTWVTPGPAGCRVCRIAGPSGIIERDSEGVA